MTLGAEKVIEPAMPQASLADCAPIGQVIKQSIYIGHQQSVLWLEDAAPESVNTILLGCGQQKQLFSFTALEATILSFELIFSSVHSL
jgi:hypothetical protein